MLTYLCENSIFDMFGYASEIFYHYFFVRQHHTEESLYTVNKQYTFKYPPLRWTYYYKGIVVCLITKMLLYLRLYVITY